jgi:hypothetical protein
MTTDARALAEQTLAVVIPQTYPLWLSYRFADDGGYYGRVIAWSPCPDGFGWDPVYVEYGHDKVEAAPVREGGPIDWLQLHDTEEEAVARAAELAKE